MKTDNSDIKINCQRPFLCSVRVQLELFYDIT